MKMEDELGVSVSGRAQGLSGSCCDKYLVSVRALKGSTDDVLDSESSMRLRTLYPHLGFILGWCGWFVVSVRAFALRVLLRFVSYALVPIQEEERQRVWILLLSHTPLVLSESSSEDKMISVVGDDDDIKKFTLFKRAVSYSRAEYFTLFEDNFCCCRPTTIAAIAVDRTHLSFNLGWCCCCCADTNTAPPLHRLLHWCSYFY
jgi:hypothetical protein